MKPIILIIIFGTVTLLSKSQDYVKPDYFLHICDGRIKISASIYSEIDPNNHSYLQVVVPAPRSTGKTLYLDYSRYSRPDTLFQHLYNWLKTLEQYADNYGKEESVVSIHMKNGSSIKVDLPLIYIKDVSEPLKFKISIS